MTVEPPFNEDLGITSYILHYSNSKIYRKEYNDITKPCYSEHIF